MLLDSSSNLKSNVDQKKPIQKPPQKLLQPKGEIGHLLRWRDDLPAQLPQPVQNSYKIFESKDIVQEHLQSFGTNIQALYINVDWSTFEMEKFKKLSISNQLLSNGMVFIWAQKEYMDQIMTHLEQFQINYVEIFTIAFLSLQKIQSLDSIKPKGTLLNFFQAKTPPKPKQPQDYLKMKAHEFPDLKANQVLVKTDSEQMFQKSKKNLLLLRKLNKKQQLQLRHQRTSDAFFGLYDQQKQQMDSKVEQCVYNMIETLLIKANYNKNEPLKMMELWARPNSKRQGWISVSEVK